MSEQGRRSICRKVCRINRIPALTGWQQSDTFLLHRSLRLNGMCVCHRTASTNAKRTNGRDVPAGFGTSENVINSPFRHIDLDFGPVWQAVELRVDMAAESPVVSD